MQKINYSSAGNYETSKPMNAGPRGAASRGRRFSEIQN